MGKTRRASACSSGIAGLRRGSSMNTLRVEGRGWPGEGRGQLRLARCHRQLKPAACHSVRSMHSVRSVHSTHSPVLHQVVKQIGVKRQAHLLCAWPKRSTHMEEGGGRRQRLQCALLQQAASSGAPPQQVRATRQQRHPHEQRQRRGSAPVRAPPGAEAFVVTTTERRSSV